MIHEGLTHHGGNMHLWVLMLILLLGTAGCRGGSAGEEDSGALQDAGKDAQESGVGADGDTDVDTDTDADADADGSTDGSYQWHTFYGSSNDDYGYSLATDVSGNVYITGETQASWNGSSGQNPLHGHSGSYDLFVLKLAD